MREYKVDDRVIAAETKCFIVSLPDFEGDCYVLCPENSTALGAFMEDEFILDEIYHSPLGQALK